MSDLPNEQNIGIGIGVLTNNAGGYNIGIGTNALLNNVSGDSNIAIGYNAGGANLTTAAYSYNTYIGNSSTIEAGQIQTSVGDNIPIQYSTSIGYDSKIFEEKQIVLGTNNDYVYVPRQMSIGKIVNQQTSRKPATGVGLDISGSLLVSRNLVVSSDISGNTMNMVDMSSNTLFLQKSLVTKGDISGNTMKMVDISSNTLYLANSLTMRGDISCNNLNTNNISGNSISIKKLSVNNIEITTNGSKADASYNTILGGNGASSSIQSGVFNSTAVGYASIIDVSNQIVLGTSGEFVCIPSSKGLSIGKTTAPASGYALDVSGQMMINNGIFAYDDLGYNTSLFSIINSGSVGYKVKTALNTYTNQNPSTNLNYGNTAIGAASLSNNTTGSGNTAIGGRSLFSNTIGYYNTSIGGDSLYNNTSGNLNISLGVAALYAHVTGSFNVAIGNNAGETDISGSNNTFLGSRSDVTNIYVTNILPIINYSTAIGCGAKVDTSNQIVMGTSDEFVCIPSNRGLSIGKTTAPASGCALDVSGSIFLTGDISGNIMRMGDMSGNSMSLKRLFVNNVEITTNGSKTNGSTADASYNTILGGNGVNTSIKSGVIPYNSTAIGYAAIIDVSNQIVVGTSGEFVCIPSNRGLSIGKTTTPASGYALDVSGAVQATTYNATSDYRIKDNIRNLDDSDTISNLRPVKYMNKISNKNDFGLIAHELQIEYPDLVSGTKDGAEYQSVNYTGLISILIKEVQDLKKIVDNQASQLETQSAQLERINKQLYPND